MVESSYEQMMGQFSQSTLSSPFLLRIYNKKIGNCLGVSLLFRGGSPY